MSERTKEELKRFLKGVLGDAVVLALSVTYTLTAFLTLSATGKSMWQVIADGVVAFLMGFFLNREFEYKGICAGESDGSVCSAVEKHSACVDLAVPYIDELDAWCDDQNRRALRRARERILAEGCLKYCDYFNADGSSVDFVPDEDKLKDRYMRKIEVLRIRTYYKALSVRLTPLSAGVLISESGRSGDPFYFGRSKIEYSRQSSRRDVVTKIILAILFGYYGVTLISNFSIANLIWKIFQVVTFLMMGTIKRDRATSYMTGEYKDRIAQKTVHLQMFMNTTKQVKEEIDVKQFAT